MWCFEYKCQCLCKSGPQLLYLLPQRKSKWRLTSIQLPYCSYCQRESHLSRVSLRLFLIFGGLWQNCFKSWFKWYSCQLIILIQTLEGVIIWIVCNHVWYLIVSPNKVRPTIKSLSLAGQMIKRSVSVHCKYIHRCINVYISTKWFILWDNEGGGGLSG